MGCGGSRPVLPVHNLSSQSVHNLSSQSSANKKSLQRPEPSDVPDELDSLLNIPRSVGDAESTGDTRQVTECHGSGVGDESGNTAAVKDSPKSAPSSSSPEVLIPHPAEKIVHGVNTPPARRKTVWTRSQPGSEIDFSKAARLVDFDPTVPWIDDDFLPNEVSLCYGNFGAKPSWEHYKWHRFTDIYDDEYDGRSIFSGISANDIFQGNLGDCYFLGALSTLAEVPSRVERQFVTTHINPAHRYEVNFFKMGMPITVAVDDFFPCKAHTVSPAFSYSPSHELWVMLWEKAWAKVHGSYLRIESGRVGYALEDISGAPHVDVIWKIDSENRGKKAHTKGLTDVETAWDMLLEANKENLPMAASMPDIKGIDMEEEWGLVEKHAYAILATHLVDNNTTRLIQLRNPWGNGTEWKGKWSDNSSEWTPERLKEVGMDESVEVAKDGIFWMSFEEFCACFSQFSILYLRPGWHRANSPKLPVDNSGCYTAMISVKHTTKAFVSLHKRDLRQLEVEADYGITRLDIIRVDAYGDTQFVCEIESSRLRDLNIELTLEKGTYRIIPFGVFPGGKPRDCVVSVYSQHPVEINASDSDVSEVEEQLSNAYKDRVSREGIEIDPGPRVSNIGAKCKTLKGTGSFALLCSNPSPDQAVLMNLKWELQNAMPCSPDTDKTMSIVVNPGERRLVRIRPNDLGATWGYELSRQFGLLRVWNSDTVSAMRKLTSIEGVLRAYNGYPAITCKSFKFESGMSLLYENKTPEKGLHEKIKFKTSNLGIVSDVSSPEDQSKPSSVGHDMSRSLDVTVVPNSIRHIILSTIEPGGWSFGLELGIRVLDLPEMAKENSEAGS